MKTRIMVMDIWRKQQFNMRSWTISSQAKREDSLVLSSLLCDWGVQTWRQVKFVELIMNYMLKCTNNAMVTMCAKTKLCLNFSYNSYIQLNQIITRDDEFRSQMIIYIATNQESVEFN
uniref:Uncharacterized protein n=1 Tax=Spironucleus salmonicida TaxID=348837 RepID=V6LWV0_9EUKA|eukprot:EST49065.1 Hypothetical protein SS50377_10668 [Spironucleus salmonicida]